MCRAGGRRCPSHLSGLARKARNAQRRAEYSAYKIDQLDDLANIALKEGDDDRYNKLYNQIDKHQVKKKENETQAAMLQKQYVASIAENAMISDEQEAKAGAEQVHPEPLEQEVVKQKQAFSKEYTYVTSDIDELATGVSDDEDEEELQEISEAILRTTDRMSADEVEAAAAYLNQKEESGAILTTLHQDLEAKAALKRQEQAYAVSDDDIETMLADETVETVEPEEKESELKKSIAALPSAFGKHVYRKASGKDLFHDTEEVVSANPELGIYKTKNTGVLADMNYFNPETIRGRIVKSNLDENSAHRDFGFREINPDEEYKIDSFNELETYSDYVEASEGDLHAMNHKKDRYSIERYTVSDYEDINDSLYENHSKKYGGVSNQLADHIKSIDSVLKKGPKRQRYLYRGVKAYSNTVSGYASPEKWAEDKFKMGEDVVFDGYQSSSSHNEGFKHFTSKNGVVFEILTPEGANITSVSRIGEECETLLPRGARYKVVGFQKGVDIEFPEDQIGSSNHRRANNTIVRLVAVNSKGEVLDGTNADKATTVKRGKN